MSKISPPRICDRYSVLRWVVDEYIEPETGAITCTLYGDIKMFACIRTPSYSFLGG